MLYRDPCVYIVEHEYQIVFNCLEKGIAWVQGGDRYFRDSTCGLMRSEELVHRICVPMEYLDKACEYTVFFRALPERRPYFPELGKTEQRKYHQEVKYYLKL